MSTPRFPKDFASTLMTVACADAVLASDGFASAYAWEAAEFGVIKRGYGQGFKTRGSLARNLSGKVVVSPRRLNEWKANRPEVIELAESPLWRQLRKAKPLTSEELLALEPAARLILHVSNLVAGRQRARVNAELFMQLAACGTLDAVAGLWTLLLEAESSSTPDLAWQCARYLPPALALAADLRPVKRVALPIFARLRQLSLDRLRFDGQALQLSSYDLLKVAESARGLPPLGLKRTFLGSRQPPVPAPWPVDSSSTIGRDVVVPEARTAWVLAHLAPIESIQAAQVSSGGGRWRAPNGTVGIGPCDPRAALGLHPLAIARVRSTLDGWS